MEFRNNETSMEEKHGVFGLVNMDINLTQML